MISRKDACGFLKGMACVYRRAHKPGHRKIEPRVVRGRAQCVAAEFEDELADLICRKVLWSKEEDVRVFTDFPITIKPAHDGCRAQETRYLDVLVCSKRTGRDFNVLYMAELKTNTGWMREKVDSYLQDHRDFIRHLRSATTMMSVRSASLKESYLDAKYALSNFYVSNNIRYDLIILSSTNNDSNSLHELKNDNDELSALIILTDDSVGGQHKKGYKPKPRFEDFKEFDRRIRRCLGHVCKEQNK